MLELQDRSILEDKYLNPGLEKLFYPENYCNSVSTKYAYAVSNESLNTYFGYLQIKDKKVATTGSSGDQLLYSLLFGSKDITVMDANLFTKPYIEYKLAMMKNFDYDEFINTFNYVDMFHWKVYSRISHDISPESRNFWDPLMLDQEEVSAKSFFDQLHGNPEDKRKLNCDFIYNNILQNSGCFITDSLFYNNRYYYDKLQEILRSNDYKIQYINDTFKNFPDILKDKYGAIILSNIYDYIDQDEFMEVVEKLYTNNLEKDGTMQVYYNFSPYPDVKFPEKILNQPLLELKTTTYVRHDRVYILTKPNETTPKRNLDNCKTM